MANLRREYNRDGLHRRDLDADALTQFNSWFQDAAKLSHEPDANAMTLATADKTGQPSARTVLLKGIDSRGFIFFTNYESRKGRELAENPNAALVFYWPELERQVCVAGRATKLPVSESEAYFKSRPKGSQLAAWASNQSDVVPNRAMLEQQWAEMAARFPTEEAPLPPAWGGYILSPHRVEFWQGRPNRLHDRFCYTRKSDQTWNIERLAP